MDKIDKSFDKKLIELEKANLNYREKYEKEKKKMFEKNLTLFGRVLYALLGLTVFLFGLFYLVMGILRPMKLTFSGRIIIGILGMICLSFSVLALLIAIKGTIKLKIHPMAIACMMFAFVIIMLAGVMSRAERFTEPLWSIQVITYGIVFLLITSLLVILNRIQQSEYNTREKLLEIELHLAELFEKIESKAKP